MATTDDDVEICNEALASLGVRVGFITDLDDSSREAQLCSLFFALARKQVLREFPFNEHISELTLANETSSLTENVPYSYRYDYPTSSGGVDVLRVLEIVDETKTRHAYKGIHFRHIGDYIYTNQNDAEVRAILDDPPTAGVMAANFLVRRAIAAKLAIMLALPITGDPKLLMTALGAYDAALRDAMANNGNRGNTVVAPPESEFIAQRLGG